MATVPAAHRKIGAWRAANDAQQIRLAGGAECFAQNLIWPHNYHRLGILDRRSRAGNTKRLHCMLESADEILSELVVPYGIKTDFVKAQVQQA